MPVNVTSKIDQPAITRTLKGRNGAEARTVMARALRVEAAAKRRAPVDTGRLRTSIHTELLSIAAYAVARVGTDVAYARAVHGGTGIYGPRKTVIRPVHARVLVWQPRGSGRIVVARQVRGVPARPFLREALNDVR